jgi:hypothetical protein
MSQNKNPLQAIIDAEKEKSGINDLSKKEVSAKIAAMIRSDNSEWVANVTAKNRNQAQDPIWREKQKQNAIAYWNSLSEDEKNRWSQIQKDFWIKMSDEEYINRCVKAKEVSNDPELKSRLRNDYYDNAEYLKELTKKNRLLAEDPVWREKVAANNKAKRTNIKHIETHQLAVKDRSENNQEWIEKNCRPVKTPQGVFLKASQARDAYIKIYGGNKTTIGMYMRQWLKDPNKPEFRYLTWDEYNSLK